MNKYTNIVLEWKYTPSDFFETPITWEGDNYQVSIDQGQAQTTLHPDVFDHIFVIGDSRG